MGVFFAILGLVVSIFSALYAYDAKEEAKEANIIAKKANEIAMRADQRTLVAYTNTVKMNFLNDFPNDSKPCFEYYASINNIYKNDAVRGEPHKVETETQRNNLVRCLPLHESKILVNELLPLVVSKDLKNKTKKAMGVLEHAASEIDNVDQCVLASELYGVMSWKALHITINNFSNSGVDDNLSLFAAIERYRQRFGGEDALASVCN